MSNMSYCRFENTLGDLQDCQDNLLNDDLSKSEFNKRISLVQVCREIVEEWESNNMDDVEFNDEDEE